MRTSRRSLAREQLAYYGALADFSFAMQGLGSGAISLFGSPTQRAAYLPAIFRGEALAAFALSEERAGSDVASLAFTAHRNDESYTLHGEKTWISNAGIADTYVVFARTAEHPTKGVSAFIVESGTPGLRLTREIPTISPHP
ncbi:MAG TPA: acyl-CoA dehydrogenase family protein, partial [Candidatus Dormibacteraeota bacterium]|nr:acyl-CoA dehydrogenase family protein [Candidatus Dormibacteraeota bacterium]